MGVESQDVRFVATIAVVSRLALAAVVLATVLVSSEYDTSVSVTDTLAAQYQPQRQPQLQTNPRHSSPAQQPPSCSDLLSRLALVLARPLMRWDAVYFLDIAENGYTFEQQFAFFPGLPLLARGLASVFAWTGGFCNHAATTLAGIAVSNISFVIATIALYHLSAHVLQDRRLARVSAVLFALSPAGIFLSSMYSESPFAAFAFLGMLCMVRGQRLEASILWSAASAIRANGILLVGFFAWDVLHPMSARSANSSLPARLVFNSLLSAIAMAPFISFQYFAWATFCDPSQTDTSHRRPWCTNTPPIIYSFVQERYWDNGLFKYYTLQQLPNFVLAAPIAAISMAGIVAYARSYTSAFLSLGFVSNGKHDKPQMPSIRKPTAAPPGTPALQLTPSSLPPPLAALPFIYLWTGMLVICLSSMHVQVIIRFFTSVPPLYWYLASLLTPHPPTSSSIGLSPALPLQASSRLGLMIYLVVYPLVGAILFANFLPPA
ncbi:GPI mannosyltransferase 2 [Entophlyctis helioformis]|nr:GPI mannosyltransferase 2 [Entophlyctis helioformis]